MSMKRKLAVIGIDGASWEIINKMLERGLLPNIDRLKNKAKLESVIPPATAAAWSAFATGNFLGKTEIYDFTMIDENSWKVNFINRKRLKGKTIWNYLDENNLKSCFINMPLTYPPDKINGIMISGIETPSKMYNYTYPSEIKEKLKEFDYEIDVSGLKTDRREIIEETMKMLDSRIKAGNYFAKQDFDFFFLLFRESDIIQHFAWDKKEVEEVYKKIDGFIGEIKKEYETLVISDHGSEKMTKAININSWLERNGYLTTKKKSFSLLSSLVKKEWIYKLLDITKLGFLIRMIPRKLGKKFHSEKMDFEEALSTGHIDLSKTRAIAKRAVKSGQIFLNNEKRRGIVKKNEEEKLKKEIKDKLAGFFDENKIKASVFTKEEIYGKNANYAPDICIYLEEDGYDTNCFFSEDKRIFVEPIQGQDAEHNLHGIIASNLNLNFKESRIIDMAPTILKYFNIRKGKFDGKSML